MAQIRMLKDHLLIRRDDDEAEIGGIAIPQEYQRAHMRWRGTVVAAGPGACVGPGDVVWFERVRTERLDVCGEEGLCLVYFDDCWGVEDDDNA